MNIVHISNFLAVSSGSNCYTGVLIVFALRLFLFGKIYLKTSNTGVKIKVKTRTQAPDGATFCENQKDNNWGVTQRFEKIAGICNQEWHKIAVSFWNFKILESCMFSCALFALVITKKSL